MNPISFSKLNKFIIVWLFLGVAKTHANDGIILNGGDAQTQTAYFKLEARGQIQESMIVDIGPTRVLIGRMKNGRLDFVDLTPAGDRVQKVGPISFKNKAVAEPVLMFEWVKRRPTLRRALRVFVLQERVFAVTVRANSQLSYLEEIQFGIGAPFSTRANWQLYQKIMTPGYAAAAAFVAYKFLAYHPILAGSGAACLLYLAKGVFSAWQQGKIELGATAKILADQQGEFTVKTVREDQDGKITDVEMNRADGQGLWLSEWMASKNCPDHLLSNGK